MKPISTAIRTSVVQLALKGVSTRNIARELSISRQSVSNVMKKSGQDMPKKLYGRPRKLGVRDERKLVRWLATGSCRSAVEASRRIEHEEGIKISVSSVNNALIRNGLNGRVRRKKPLLRKKHRQRRYAFALKYRQWNMDQWKHVVWSDESKFNVFASDGRQYCWRRVGDQLRDHHTQPTVKHGGGSIMVWRCITWEGVGHLCRINNGLDAELYRNILEDEFLGTLDWYGLNKDEITFQHDNDPKHTARSTKQWLDEQEINVLTWPAQSPDLNPIEHVWNEVGRRIRNWPMRPSSKDSLWEIMQEVWNGIEVEFCRKLISSMPNRLADVRKVKGGYTVW